jgi:hypothetical protein
VSANVGGYPFQQEGVGDWFSAADCGRAADAVRALAVTVHVAYTASAAARKKGRISDTL